ncbi:2-(1,2-epoxy-1,2-dihydrophenyl)acetyl-CoA isomerase PaaG [Tateyamaria omphalii]|uniref:2-(1,2-epoxy-1,2-dihydrophenyl)acetyl-CoA isomerase PaaG n=1 Tax=Tateyamaria omphalii TaxID=299262 RepID=UPI001C98F3FE|nr:2-(1,2-epoxy-1,2-dihydrophenyl)acetyl-CoA isomerase PaaG [Tateyamaria omphalii]MBY5935192.1 2-(1,2-epoxy-1,2-dihydrophenyl)acetyl-CoA isomerase PaaG [Tateyamaria omphalii]
MGETILNQDHGTWSEITLNRPDKLNSFNEDMHLALRERLEHAIQDGKRAILLTGAGRGFCAGQDLGDRDPAKMDGPPDLGDTLTRFYNPLVRLIRDAELPVICAVNGVAAGAGANLAMACDIVLAADTAKFVQSFANVGLVPDAGGSWNLTRLLGPARAKALAMTGEPLPATQAADWGMIWRAVPAEDLMAEARALTARLANGPTQGFAHTKKAMNAATMHTLDQQLELEARFQKACGQSADYAEGVAAFLNKRKPEFSGQ